MEMRDLIELENDIVFDKYCGIYENAGGGTPINALDRCSRTHDVDIKGKKRARQMLSP